MICRTYTYFCADRPESADSDGKCRRFPPAQCASAQVPFFGKQNVRKAPLPEDLMVREFPKVTA